MLSIFCKASLSFCRALVILLCAGISSSSLSVAIFDLCATGSAGDFII